MSCLWRILGLRWFDFVPNVSVTSQTQQRSICSRLVTDVFQYLDMYVACKSLYQRMKHFAWLSKPVLVTDLTIGRNGNVHAVILDKPGSVSWKPTSGSPPMLLGTWPVIFNSGGHIGPSLVNQSSE